VTDQANASFDDYDGRDVPFVQARERHVGRAFAPSCWADPLADDLAAALDREEAGGPPLSDAEREASDRHVRAAKARLRARREALEDEHGPIAPEDPELPEGL
jgi:hypothetical protein